MQQDNNQLPAVINRETTANNQRQTRPRPAPDDEALGQPCTNKDERKQIFNGAMGGSIPKTVILDRSPLYGYGFTLRHFIVYPPDESDDESIDRSDEEKKSLFINRQEPLDTIFVRQVRPDSPAHLAGLTTGDRILRVNETDVQNNSYQEVINSIQNNFYPKLHLVVVPKENDLLQQIFGSTAHNPESNLNLSCSSWSSISSLPSTPSSSQTTFFNCNRVTPNSNSRNTNSSNSNNVSRNNSSRNTSSRNSSMPGFPAHRKVKGGFTYGKTKQQNISAGGVSSSQSSQCGKNLSEQALQATTPLTSSIVDRKQAVYKQQHHQQQATPLTIVDRKQAVYNIKSHLPFPLQRCASEHDAITSEGGDYPFLRVNKISPTTMDNSAISSSKRSGGVFEPVVVRGELLGEPKRLEKDPDGRLYEVVKSVTANINSSANISSRFPVNVDDVISPHQIYSPSSSLDGGCYFPLTKSQTEANIIGTTSTGRRKGISQYQNLSSLYSTGNPAKAAKLDHFSYQPFGGGRLADINKENIVQNKENIVYSLPTREAIDRIKKTVDCKEEFLKRTNDGGHIPWKVVRREFRFSPQKMSRPMWPPPATSPTDTTPPGSITKSLAFMFDQRNDARQCFQARSNSLPSSPFETTSPTPPSTTPQTSLPYYINPLVGNNVAKPYGKFVPAGDTSGDAPAKTPNKSPFVSTLSRIHENIPYAADSSVTPTSGDGRYAAHNNSTPTPAGVLISSPPVCSVPMAWVNDNERIKQLQIVSTRARKFEELSPTTIVDGVKMSDDKARKMAFHRFELARLSQRTNGLNVVADRKREFERRASDAQINSPVELGTSFNYHPKHKRNYENAWRSSRASGGGGLMKSLSDGGSIFPLNKGMLPSSEEPYYGGPPFSMDVPLLHCTGNRIIPVGGGKIHCDPPDSRDALRGHRPLNDTDLLKPDRDRSNSTVSDSFHWSPFVNDPTRRKSSPIIRQHSFNTIQSHLARAVSSLQQRIGANDSNATRSAVPSSPSKSAVTKRNKHLYVDEGGDRLVRRVSYLKATSGDRIYSDSEVESDDERQFAPVSPKVSSKRSLAASIDLPSPASFHSSVTSSGNLHVKLAKVQGKRAGDRSWKSVWAVLQGRALLLYKDKQQAAQTPLAPEEQVTLRGSNVGIATDYTKRRHVFRLSTPAGSQFLFQAESDPAMTAWLTSLSAATSQDDDQNRKSVTAPLADAETLSPCLDGTGSSLATTPTPFSDLPYGGHSPEVTNVSPQIANKNVKKVTSPQRSKVPVIMEPMVKNKKSTGDYNSSPKCKTWKGKLGKQLRKMQGVSTGAAVATPSESLPEGASIGVCLEDCPPSPENDYVPLLVSLCVSVVEKKGITIQGIYRVPGNRAAVTYLTEVVNRGPNAVDLSDTRWSDVNVISSLLKHFFRKLPDPLITSELYPHFIEASKMEDPQQRLIELKHLVQELPDHHYETLRFLCLHLNHVITQSSNNKMDVRNLAIVFGPTLVRASDDNMAKMVTDMSHQCQIVEMLLSHVIWFFEDDSDDALPPLSSLAATPNSQAVPMLDIPTSTGEPMESSSQSLLLNNVQKLEANNKDTKKLIVSSIISAANRRVQKVRKRIEEETNDENQDFVDNTTTTTAALRSHRVTNNSSCYSGHSSSNNSNRDGRLFADFSSDVVDKLSENNSDYPTPERTLSNPDPTSLNYVVGGVVSSPPASASSGHHHKNPSSLSRSEPSYLSEDVAIKSYTGLSASTQERIRRFETETHAMLQRDATRHRRELEKRKIEEELQRAKKDLETEDIFDRLADNPSEVMHMMSNCWSPNREAVSLPSLPNKPPCGLSLANASASLSTNAKDDINPSEDQNVNQQRPHNEGSDLMSAITATFEEKMRLLSRSLATSEDKTTETIISSRNSVVVSSSNNNNNGNNSLSPVQRAKTVTVAAATGTKGNNNKCKLYRDPSLHRRRTNLHCAPAVVRHSASSDAIANRESFTDYSDQKENKEKRSRVESSENKKSQQEERLRELETPFATAGQKQRKQQQTQLQQQQNNVRELKEKFERNIPASPPLVIPNNNNEKWNTVVTPSPLAPTNNSSSDKRKRKSRIKRRHTVGGMKDMARVAWLKVIEAAHYDDAQKLPSWEQLQLFIEALADGRRSECAPAHKVAHWWAHKDKLDADSWTHKEKLAVDSWAPKDKLDVESWVAREKLGVDSWAMREKLDVDAIVSWAALPKESLKRRLSVREPKTPALHPVLESNV